jgi:mono/diheme cytochrome c family protein
VVDAYPTTYRGPAVPYQALSIANGLHLFQEHCTVCHGVTGRGDGPAAAGLWPRPADLTAKHTADHTTGDLFWWLTYGCVREIRMRFKQGQPIDLPR